MEVAANGADKAGAGSFHRGPDDYMIRVMVKAVRAGSLQLNALLPDVAAESAGKPGGELKHMLFLCDADPNIHFTCRLKSASGPPITVRVSTLAYLKHLKAVAFNGDTAEAALDDLTGLMCAERLLTLKGATVFKGPVEPQPDVSHASPGTSEDAKGDAPTTEPPAAAHGAAAAAHGTALPASKPVVRVSGAKGGKGGKAGP